MATLKCNTACLNKKTALMRVIVGTNFVLIPISRALVLACIISAHHVKRAKLLIIRKLID
jgi:hypothetical protein